MAEKIHLNRALFVAAVMSILAMAGTVFMARHVDEEYIPLLYPLAPGLILSDWLRNITSPLTNNLIAATANGLFYFFLAMMCPIMWRRFRKYFRDPFQKVS